MLRFGAYLLDPAARRLWHDGQPVPLRDAALTVLLTLAQQPGQVVSKRTLCEAAWPALADAENNLHVEISALRKRLGSAWVVTVPGRGYQFAGTPQGATSEPGPGLIGRESDLATLRAAVRPARLVTIAGEAGIGKTRLAQALAKAWSADGALWIDASPTALGRARAALVEQARTRTLVILDGCDTALADAAPWAAAVLDTAPATALVATSRERLRVPGEVVLRLGGLAALPAARLWAQALQKAMPADAGPQAEPSSVEALCRAVDGHPLVIVAAARWCAAQPGGPGPGLRRLIAQPVSAWLDLLDDEPVAGTSGRNRTPLRVWLAAPLGALAPAEHELLRRLADSEHPRHADDLAATWPDPWEAIEALGRLADRSLVRVTGPDDGDVASPPRHGLSPVVRALLAATPR